jgi:two-component system nitrogen regulation sensor histidine kinase NtrY
MRSLRSRLILGSALIALVPLTAAMLFLTRRIETTVRAQAAGRLEAALGGLRTQVRADGERVTEQLGILGRDRELRRLYLVRTGLSRDLDDYLAERRVLLGLDLLRVADLSGQVVARGDTATAADGADLRVERSAPIFYQGERSGVVSGGLTIDAAFLARLERSSGIELILRDAAGRTVAATSAVAPAVSGSAAGLAGATDAGAVRRVSFADRSYLARDLVLPLGSARTARITGLISTAPLDRTIAVVQWTSLGLGVLGLALAVLLGLLWSSQVSRPVERLAAFSQRVAQGQWDEPLTLESVRELQTLVAALDRMRGDLRAYRERLVASERQAAWSQMARIVAHEVKNPLTPIAISIADLKRSFDQQRPEFPAILEQAVRTIGDEVDALRRMLQEFSEFARLPAPSPSPCTANDLLADLGVLYARELAEGRLAIAAPERELALTADAGQLRQALVNLIRNGLEAVNGAGCVHVGAALDGDAVAITVADDGPGLGDEQRSRLFTPGFTTKSEGSGLGLTVVQRIVLDHRGTVAVETARGTGTTFRIRLPRTPEDPPCHRS